jgi:hypothetical protein
MTQRAARIFSWSLLFSCAMLAAFWVLSHLRPAGFLLYGGEQSAVDLRSENGVVSIQWMTLEIATAQPHNQKFGFRAIGYWVQRDGHSTQRILVVSYWLLCPLFFAAGTIPRGSVLRNLFQRVRPMVAAGGGGKS